MPTVEAPAKPKRKTRSGDATMAAGTGTATASGNPATLTSKESWRDWLPPDAPDPPNDELLTRAQFLDHLRERGVDIGESTLTHWERAGALPHPVRRWRGSTPATWYPRWLVPLAARVPGLRDDGLELRDIGPRLRQIFVQDSQRLGSTDGATVVEVPANGTSKATEDDITPALVALARRYLRITGARTVRIQGTMTDDTGATLSFRVDSDAPDSSFRVNSK